MIIHVLDGERPEILGRVEALDFVVFDNGYQYDLNIIAERNPNGVADRFDDWIHVIYRANDQWNWHAYPCTTDAGEYYLKQYATTSGTAILCHPQQMRSVYSVDLHRGHYLALCQRNGPVKVWRDANRDSIHDMSGEIDEGYFGINIHQAGRNSTEVGKWSAGCTVLQHQEDFKEFMQLCDMQVRTNGFKFFTYTLILGN